MIVTNGTDVITFSQDGITPDRSIKKSNVSNVTGVFLANVGSFQANPLNMTNKTTIEITLNGGDKIAFDAQSVSTPVGWNLGTQASLNVAVNAILGWI